MEWPAKRSYVGLVAVGVQEQAEDVLVPPVAGATKLFDFELHFFFLVIISPPEQWSLQ